MSRRPTPEQGAAAGPVGVGGLHGDRIEVAGLRMLGTHGVLPEERERPQPFEVDLVIAADLALAVDSDRLADTVDYGGVVDAATDVVGGPHPFDLLEALAGAVAGAVLAVDARITAVTVALRKVRPPLGADVATVGVVITRGR